MNEKKDHKQIKFSYRKYTILYVLYTSQYPLTIREMVQHDILKKTSAQAVISAVQRAIDEKIIEQVGNSYQITPIGEKKFLYLQDVLNNKIGGLPGLGKYIHDRKIEKYGEEAMKQREEAQKKEFEEDIENLTIPEVMRKYKLSYTDILETQEEK